MSVGRFQTYPCIACSRRSRVPRIMCPSCHQEADRLVENPTPWMLARRAERPKAENTGFFVHGRKAE